LKKILVISTSPFPYGNNITDGPGYRAWHLLQALAKKHEIVILSLYESYHLGQKGNFLQIEENDIKIKPMQESPRGIADQIELENPDVLYLPWSATPFLGRVKHKIPTVLDYVGAGLLEEYATRGYIPLPLLQLKIKSFWLGDFFLTAGERERYYLLGLLAASKKLSYENCEHRSSLIHVIPMTPPTAPPISTKTELEKKPDELVLLVAGAFLPWYDYKTFFEALRILISNGEKNFRVLIMGGNPRDPKFEATVKRFGCVKEIEERIIFTGLVPFKQRANYYLTADIAVNIPSVTVEDELSVRTRVVDYLWANLPILSPATDEYSSTIVKSGGGFCYQAQNPKSLSNQISFLIKDKEKLAFAKSKLPDILLTKFNIDNYLSELNHFIENPFVDPLRKSNTALSSEVFLWLRDIYNMIKH
jgi:glycosyltransferase involved in cell wall biosynthesis